MKNEYRFMYKKRLYLIRVNPDIAVHGGQRGKGTTTYINPLEADGVTVVPEMRGFQGRHSKAAIIRVIEKNWSKK